MNTQSIPVNTPNIPAPRFLQSQNVARTTMSSREISELTGKRHDHVMRDIRNMLSELKITDPKFGGTYLDGAGRSLPCFHLDRELTETLVTGYSIPLRHKVIRRLHELEDAQTAQPVAMPSYSEALRLYADQIEQTAVLRVENHQQAEKIASLESIFQVGMTPTQFCKRLNGVNCQQVNNALLACKWIFNSERDEKRSVKFRVGSIARDKYLTEKVTNISNEGMDTFAKYTPILLKEGAKRLHDLYMAQKLPMKKTWDGQFCHCKATEEDMA